SDPVSASLANDVESADGTTLVVGGRRTAMDGPFRAAVWRLEGDGVWARLPQDTEIFGGAQIVNMNALVNADGVWIAAGDMSDEAMTFRMGRVWASEDGITWFRLDPEGDVFGTYGDGFVAVRNLTFDGERLIAVGQRFGVGAVWVGAIEP
ncbi:MAG: hypothetical protein OEM66_07165, partial [Acidimicrobiia bacterium]|nr:hypothetical protein [Acidimicrobiia bacterium]